MARRDNSDPDETGAYLGWTYAWPMNRRILYNRCSADMQASPGTRPQADQNGTAKNGWATTCRHFAVTAKPDEVGLLHHEPRGTSRLFTRA